jgi:hypothetical protein
MWRLLKAEMNYDRLRISLFLFLCMGFFLAIWLGVRWERNRIPMIMLIVLVMSLSAVYAGEKNRTVQKKDRLHVLFPVSLWRIGITHLLYPLIVLSVIYCLLFLSVLAARLFVNYVLVMPSLVHMLTLAGFVLIVNAVALLQRDLRMTSARNPQRIFVLVLRLVVYIGVLLPFYVITNFMGVFGEDTPVQNFFTRLLDSPAGFMAAGLLLSVLSLVVFVNRRSYADS